MQDASHPMAQAGGEWILLLSVGLAYLSTWVFIPRVLLSNKRPSSMLLWIGGTIFVPFITPILYLIFGSDRLRRNRLSRLQTDGARSADNGRETTSGFSDLPDADERLVRTITGITRLPCSSVTSVQVLPNSEAFYPHLLASIEAAQHHIHCQVYVWGEDSTGKRFLNALVDAARRGVEVRLLVDELGSVETSGAFFEPLRQAGGQFSWCYTVHPRRNRYFLNHRNHRKLQIIDGEVAYVGGMNIGAEYEGADERFGDWEDLQLALHGEVVGVLQEVFANDWYFATRERYLADGYIQEVGRPAQAPCLVVESGPDSDRKPFLKTAVALCYAAENRLDLFTPYFVPVASLIDALQVAAARGVQVRLMVSEKNDHRYLVTLGRSYYEELLRFGVEIYEYSEAVHHTKAILVDGHWMMVGSANLDVRSIDLNFELNVVIRSEEKCRDLDSVFGELFANSRQLDLESFSQRTRREKLAEGFSRLWAPLL